MTTGRKSHDVALLTVDSIQEGVGASQVLNLAKAIATRGVGIALVSMEKHAPTDELIDEVTSANIHWKALPFGRPGAAGAALRVARLAARIPKADVLHCRSDFPVASAIVANRRPFLWDVRSLWADQRVALGGMTEKSAEYRLMRGLESRAFHSSSAITTLTENAWRVLNERYGLIRKPHAVVSTCVDLSLFIETAMPPTDPLNLMVSGTFNDYYDLDATSRFVNACRLMGPTNVSWVRSPDAPRDSLGFEDVVLSVDHSEMPRVVRTAHAGLSICRWDAGISLTAAAPTKNAEFLASGRPIVVNDGLGDYASLLTPNGAGVVLSDNSESQLLQGAGQLRELINSGQAPHRCRSVAEQHFSLRKGVDDLLDLYQIMARGEDRR